jgi:WD40 repeat protein
MVSLRGAQRRGNRLRVKDSLTARLLCALLLSVFGTAAAAPPKPAVSPVPLRKAADVAVPLPVSVPAELVPLKPGTTEKVSPANLRALWKVGPLPPVSAMCFSADGKLLFTGAYGRVSVWDLEQGRVSARLEGVEGAVHDLSLSPDGKLLAVAGGSPAQSGTVLIYDAVSPGKPLRKIGDHTDVVYGVAWTTDVKRMATASFDKTVKVWDTATGAVKLMVKDHTDAVLAVAFSPDGNVLVSGGRDNSVKMFDSSSGKSLRTLTGHNEDVHAIAVSADGRFVISAGVERQLRWWDTATGRSRNAGTHNSQVYEIRRSADGKQIVSVSEDQTVRLWDGANGSQQKSFNAGEPLLSAALSADGKRIAAGSASGMLRLWDVASGRLLVQGIERPESSPQHDYMLATPEGFLTGTDAAIAQLGWEIGGQPVPPEPIAQTLLKRDEVQKALRGEAVTKPKIELPK